MPRGSHPRFGLCDGVSGCAEPHYLQPEYGEHPFYDIFASDRTGPVAPRGTWPIAQLRRVTMSTCIDALDGGLRRRRNHGRFFVQRASDFRVICNVILYVPS